MSRRVKLAISSVAILVVAFLAICQLVVPSIVSSKVKEEVLRYVPRSQQKTVVITTSLPFPAALSIFGELGKISVRASELQVTAHSDFFSLIKKTSRLSVHAHVLKLKQIALQNISLQSSGDSFSFQGTVSASAISESISLTPITGKVMDEGIPLETTSGPLVLLLIPSANGEQILAGLTNTGPSISSPFVILEDHSMHVSSVQIKPRGEEWLVVVRGDV